MRSFVLLLKIQLLGLFGINKALHSNACKVKRLLVLTGLAAVGVAVLVALYVGTIAAMFVRLGLTDAVPFVAAAVGAVVGAVAAFLKAHGMLFAFKDYDLVMSLPVRTSTVVLSRIASLYAMSVVGAFVVMVPSFAVYVMAEGVVVTPAGAVCMVLSVLIVPLIPLVVAIALAALIAAVSSRFKHANLIITALSFLAVLAVVAGSFMLSSNGGDPNALAASGAASVQALTAFYPPAAWAAAGMTRGDLLSFALFAGLSLAAVAALVAVLVKTFVPVNALLMSSRPGGTFSFDDAGRAGGTGSTGSGKGAHALRTRSPFRALVAKELRLLFATPVYLLNGCMGYVMVIVGAVAAVVARAMGALPIEALPPELVPVLGAFLPWVLAFCLGISSTTAPSVSLEGQARWLMQTAPVSARTVLGAKAAVNLLFAVPTVLVGGVLLAFAFPLDAAAVAALFAVPTAFALLSTFLGLALDALYPRYDWTTVYEPVKRGMPVFAVVFGGMVLVVVGVAAAALGGVLAAFAVAALVAVSSLLLWKEVLKRGLVE